jgi:hypothetical protein
MFVHNDFPGIVGEECEWYSLHSLNSVPCFLLEIQITPPYGNSALISTHAPFLVDAIPRVAETVKIVINKMTP